MSCEAVVGARHPWPTLTVIMPCRNEARYIAESISSILAFDYPPDRLDILVADGMSDDGTTAILQELATAHPRLRVLANPGRMPAPGLNLAIAQSRAEIVLRVDAHAAYPPAYARRCVAALQATGAANVGGTVVAAPGAATATARAITIAMSHRFGVGNAGFRTGVRDRQWTDTVPFGCWRRATLLKLGAFATDIPYGEDDEFNARLRKQGGRILLDPEISSTYFTRPTLRALALQMYRYGRHKPLTSKRIGRVTSLRQLVPPLFVAAVFTGLAASIVVPTVLPVVVGIMLAHLGAGSAVAAGQTSKLGAAAILLPPIFLVMHSAYGTGYLAGTLALLAPQQGAVPD